MSVSMKTIWEEFLKIVAQEVGSHVVQTWLNAVTLINWDQQEKVVYVKAPNMFVKEWIKSNYLALFQAHLSRLLYADTVRISFVDEPRTIEPAVSHAIIPAVPLPRIEDPASSLPEIRQPVSKYRSSLNKAYHFDSFIVGPSNKLAYAAAHAVTEKLGKLYNPLFIYGGSGLGKTHLLHAIGNSVKTAYKRAAIMYQTADHFVSDFIHSIRYDKVPQFKTRYTDIDVLLIDDVQFISNKEQTQEVFFHIFNTLYEARKQIVFTSDSDPSHIQGLAERLRSRFAWGLVTDIQIPTTETKIAILKHKTSVCDQILPDEVLEFIAEHVFSNVRELEGALIRVTAFATLTNQPITLEMAQKVLHMHKVITPHTLDGEKIVQVLNKYYACSLSELRAHGRAKQVAFVRQLAMYLMKRCTNKALQEIGHYFDRKDHTTVLYAVQKIQKLRDQDKVLHTRLKELEQMLCN